MARCNVCCFSFTCYHGCGHFLRTRLDYRRTCVGEDCSRTHEVLMTTSALRCTACLDAQLVKMSSGLGHYLSIQGHDTDSTLRLLNEHRVESEDADTWARELLEAIVLSKGVYNPDSYRNDIAFFLGNRPAAVQHFRVSKGFADAYEVAERYQPRRSP
ncbi:hypothetical protein ISF_01618 [Cordyceps fumosorosea ARSEF 2679]|uniref:Uncharacterized protein n=1 Tax=Cordyceps fumosorosea (strain ARSEF 2679) TaxID=1081104 RepID=A0A168DFD1_CORFA|nr:hypothetical protein ISF_01618 [Cordyceps fumosorosea ARSEF 2679]OAA72545.1 hypothetical protein ISF_01618 [Cordyceps fumosorosea ARSEF 2679]